MKKHPNSQPPRRDNLADPAYRPNVGIALFNAAGFVFLGERKDNPGSWQMPQGGIDDNEDPEIAVFREMREEIGTNNARILRVMDDWIYYDFPKNLGQRLWDGKYKGQRQKWIALEFLGSDADIQLDAHTQPEFDRWKWVPLDQVMSHIVAFKRDVYAYVVQEFAGFAKKK